MASSVIKEFQINQQWGDATHLLEGLRSKTSQDPIADKNTDQQGLSIDC